MNVISQASSLNPGSDLWVVPERKNCFSTQKIDWYLNFQISRASKHQAKTMPQRLTEILEKCGMPDLALKERDDKTLLISSSAALPNRWVLVVKGSEEFESWVASLARTHDQMKAPSLRVFLPTGRTPEEFQKIWNKASSHKEVAVVADA